MTIKKYVIGFSLVGITLAASASAALQLGIPIDCEYGKECFIQKYHDLDPRKETFMDYSCGTLSSNEHNGTDFRLRDFTVLQKNIPVLAAEEGTVKATRDGMEDITVSKINVETLKGMYCGNAVLLTHKGDYETQYCHLKKGSVKVVKEDKVTKGQVIGYVGLSGDTEYPHLHFSVRKKDMEVDPFVGDYAPFKDCRQTRYPLWDQKALATLTYIPTASLNTWFFTTPPKADEARNGVYESFSKLTTEAPLIILATDMFGAQKGDVLKLELTNPQKKVILTDSHTFDAPKAQYFYYVGKYRKAEPWLIGQYIGHVTLMRGDKTVFEVDKNLFIE